MTSNTGQPAVFLNETLHKQPQLPLPPPHPTSMYYTTTMWRLGGLTDKICPWRPTFIAKAGEVAGTGVWREEDIVVLLTYSRVGGAAWVGHTWPGKVTLFTCTDQCHRVNLLSSRVISVQMFTCGHQKWSKSRLPAVIKSDQRHVYLQSSKVINVAFACGPPKWSMSRLPAAIKSDQYHIYLQTSNVYLQPSKAINITFTCRHQKWSTSRYLLATEMINVTFTCSQQRWSVSHLPAVNKSDQRHVTCSRQKWSVMFTCSHQKWSTLHLPAVNKSDQRHVTCSQRKWSTSCLPAVIKSDQCHVYLWPSKVINNMFTCSRQQHIYLQSSKMINIAMFTYCYHKWSCLMTSLCFDV